MSSSTQATQHAADLVNILNTWADKPGGLLHKSFDAMTMFADIGSQNTMSDDERIGAMRGFTLTTSYISAAKDCLTEAVIDTMISNSMAWSAGLVSKREVSSWVEQGANMTDDEFDLYIKQEDKLFGPRARKTILYTGLCYSGVDGLNTEEIIRFLRVGRRMGISEEELNELLITYFHECSLIQAFKRNVENRSMKQSKL